MIPDGTTSALAQCYDTAYSSSKKWKKYFFFPSFYNLMRFILASSTSLSRMLLSFFKSCTLLSLILLSLLFLAHYWVPLDYKIKLCYCLMHLKTAFLMHVEIKTLEETHMSACAIVLLSLFKWVEQEIEMLSLRRYDHSTWLVYKINWYLKGVYSVQN